MLDPFVWLLLLSITMLIGSFVFGCIPLATKMSDVKLRYFTAVGAGLLIGTALIVIIPEGVQTLYTSDQSMTSTLPLNTNPQLPLYDADLDDLRQGKVLLGVKSDHTLGVDGDHTHQDTHSHTAIGLSLIIGFAAMFVIDQVSSLHYHASSGADQHELDSLNSDDQDNDTPLGRHVPHAGIRSKSMTPTIGLIVHAAADGIALGASATHPQLSMVVFIAIMLHKGPSAFALTTVLLSEGMSRVEVRKHLLAFSLAAPLGALLTYIVLYSTSSTNSTSLAWWTGVLLIFSGGTFLYVAMHALQELQPQSSSNHSDKLDRSFVATILCGMFLPALVSIHHSH